MNNIWTLFKNNLKIQIVKKPVSFIVFLLAPVVIMFMAMKILFSSSGFLNVGVIDNDKSDVSLMVIEEMQQIDSINVREIDEDEIKSSFAENTLNGVIKINEGFQDGIIAEDFPKIEVITKEGEGDVEGLITSILKRKINNLLMIAKAAKGDESSFQSIIAKVKDEDIISLQKKSLSDLEEDFTSTQIFLGFLIFFMLLRGNAHNKHYYDEKKENIFNRFFVAPVKVYEYYLADFLSSICIIIIQILIGVIGMELLGVNLGLSIGQLIIICLSIGIASVTLSICVRSFFKDEGAYNIVFTFIIMVLIMIGGCFIPVDMLPETLNKISYFTPVRWAVEALLNLQQGMGMKNAVFDIMMILLFALIFFVVAICKTAYGEKAYEN